LTITKGVVKIRKRKISKPILKYYYIFMGMTISEVAKKLRAGTNTVRRELARQDLKMKSSEKRKSHGMSGTRPYRIWAAMKDRCNNSNNSRYEYYGGKGITYTNSWDNFENFWNDMKETYSKNLTLDRIDSNKNYNKDNCRWVSYKIQNNNRDCNIKIEYKGRNFTVSDIVENTNLNKTTIYNRIEGGWTIEEILENPDPLNGKKVKKHSHNKKPILQYDTRGNFIQEFESQSRAGKELNLDRGNIGKCCRGQQNTCGGFIFKFKNK